jgi:hypothetical protein
LSSIESQLGSKVANNTLTSIIETTEDEFKLKKGSIRPKTTMCRLLCKNLNGEAKATNFSNQEIGTNYCRVLPVDGKMWASSHETGRD